MVIIGDHDYNSLIYCNIFYTIVLLLRKPFIIYQIFFVLKFKYLLTKYWAACCGFDKDSNVCDYKNIYIVCLKRQLRYLKNKKPYEIYSAHVRYISILVYE